MNPGGPLPGFLMILRLLVVLASICLILAVLLAALSGG